MRFEVPLLVCGPETRDGLYSVRPLFFEAPREEARMLSQARARLVQSLRSHLETLSRQERHEDLVACSFNPELHAQLLNLQFEHQKRTARLRLLVVTFRALGRRLAFSPSLPDQWFELERGQELEAATLEMLREFFRRKPNRDLEPESLSVASRTWVDRVEFNLEPPRKAPAPKTPSLLALLGGRDIASGRDELNNVGRCLSWMPDQLERCLERESELTRLQSLMSRTPRAAVLVVGARLVGKTALVHEHVRRHCGKRSDQYWHLSPQRLISGMSYLGQWESRLVKILRYVRAKNLVLVLDDLLGWLTAGISRDATMGAADVLKPFLEKSELRVLAEITPEAFAVLQERDRGLADRFEILRLDEMAPQTSMRVLLDTVRNVEETQRCVFTSRAVLEVEVLASRFLTDAARPGKAARMARQLGARFREGTVDRPLVLQQFSQRSGLSLELLDPSRLMPRAEALEALRKRVVGQPAALEVLADTVSIFKARLADPGRPVAGLLFVGPTGVGKTECAKALAAFLYGDEERLVRFDMNEYVGYDAVPRLVGSAQRPDGLLTSALRRQPFCVVPLDEVEKAHPDALNLLLQILGDGRLTDTLGRTADFTQAILILTSNLGARELGRPLGLRSQSSQEELAYRRAAEEFFPPELFNRLDRVVPFGRLAREDVARLAEHLLSKLLARDGLVRRQCLLEIDPAARERLVDLGHDPQLGARALKRSLERQVAAPVGRKLAAMAPDLPTLVRLGPGLEITVEALLPVPARRQPPGDLQPFVDQLKQDLARLSPKGRVAEEDLSEESLFYFELQDLVRQLEGKLRRPGKGKLPPFVELAPEQVEALWRRSDLRAALGELACDLPPLKERELQAQNRDARATAAQIREALRKRRYATRRISVSHPFLVKAYLMLDEVRSVKGGLEIGPTALLDHEEGVHLFFAPEGLTPVRVGEGSAVVRLYAPEGVLDLATGLFAAGPARPEDLVHFWLAGMPL